MKEIKIETGILPPNKYPFKDMNVGDSFFVDANIDKPMTSIYGNAYMFGKKHKMKFSLRRMNGGVRVWRIK